MMSLRYDNCKRCGALVLPEAMADHWIIAGHLQTALLPGSAEHDDRRTHPAAYVPNVLRKAVR